MALFIDSTQATHWTIPSDKLAERRASTNTRIQATLAKRANVHRHDRDQADQHDMLSIDDEAAIRTYHERRILSFIRKTGLPDKVAATAVTYFKRFYVDRSVTEFNPSVIALSALYASGKVEEVYLPADRLVADFDILVNKIPRKQLEKEQQSRSDDDVINEAMLDAADGTAMRVSEDALLHTELAFLQRLQFHLVCYHGFRSLGALREVLKTQNTWVSVDQSDVGDKNKNETSSVKQENETLRRICRSAHKWLAWRLPLTELVLTETPAVIALAACAGSAADQGVEDGDDSSADSVVRAAAPGMDGVLAGVRTALWTMREMGDDDVDVCDMDVIKGLERKRRRWQIQENDPVSQRFRELKKGEDERRFMQDREKAAAGSKKRGRGSGGGGWSDDDEDDVLAVDIDDGDGLDGIIASNNDVSALDKSVGGNRGSVKRARLLDV